MTSQTDTRMFEEIVAGWGQRVQCQKVSGLPHQCRNPASWRAVRHCGTERVLLCTRHKNLWIAHHQAVIHRDGDVDCSFCEQRFTNVSQIAAFSRL